MFERSDEALLKQVADLLNMSEAQATYSDLVSLTC